MAPTSASVDILVIGGGAMGSATARTLAARGRDVLLLERFAPGHTEGASHGASRNFNVTYADPTYIAMLRESLVAWRDLEAHTGQQILDLAPTPVNVLLRGETGSGRGATGTPSSASACASAGVA